ncbi:hypothetical protein [Xanthomarina spongicola]|jgi:hypothetical protein|uniref:Uncharacterized protein n=1 Tax=Xanthomarina spongicola TaxID=570520 RepID=A0A316DKW3_9FLAO|nr:hypothetical protein [Xanthomarina spongicola]PWK18218.1 hypothetical protein LX78_02127 [Xanthomarina spongicola]
MTFLYFDPAIGAMIVQAIVAAIAGVLLFSKNLLLKVKVFFGLAKSKEEDLFDDIEIEKSEIEKKDSSDS